MKEKLNWPKNPKLVNAILGLSIGGQGLQAEALELFYKDFRFLGQKFSLFDVFGFSGFRKKISLEISSSQKLQKPQYFLDNFPECILKFAENSKKEGLFRNYEKRLRGENAQGLLDFRRDFIAEVLTESKTPDDILQEFIKWFEESETSDIEYIHFTGVIPLIEDVPFICDKEKMIPFPNMEELKAQLDVFRKECRSHLSYKLRKYLYEKKYCMEEIRLRFLKDFQQIHYKYYGFEMPVVIVDFGELIPSETPNLQYQSGEIFELPEPRIKKIKILDKEFKEVLYQYEAKEDTVLVLKQSYPENKRYYDVFFNGKKVHETIDERCIIADRGGPIDQVRVNKIGGIFNPNYFAFSKREDLSQSIIESMEQIVHEKERIPYLDIIICNDKRLELQKEIYDISCKFEALYQMSFSQGLKEDYPECQRYRICKKSLKYLADSSEDPFTKMRRASNLLNEPEDQVEIFLGKKRNSIELLNAEEQKISMIHAIQQHCRIYLKSLQMKKEDRFFSSKKTLTSLVVKWIKMLNCADNLEKFEEKLQEIRKGLESTFEFKDNDRDKEVELINKASRFFLSIRFKLSEKTPANELLENLDFILSSWEERKKNYLRIEL